MFQTKDNVDMTIEERLKQIWPSFMDETNAGMSEDTLKIYFPQIKSAQTFNNNQSSMAKYRQERCNKMTKEQRKNILDSMHSCAEISLGRYAQINQFTKKHGRLKKNKISDLHIPFHIKKLFTVMIENNFDMNVIDSLDITILKWILSMFGYDYPMDRSKSETDCSVQSVNYQLDVEYLIAILRLWDGWTKPDPIEYLSTQKAYVDLYYYLFDNFEYYQSNKGKWLLDELDNHCPTSHTIHTSCSIKQLKVLFYHNPHNYVKYYSEDASIIDSLPVLNQSLPYCLFNWAHISIQISLPNFSMTRWNNHLDEYHLLNITEKMKFNVNENLPPQEIVKSNGYLIKLIKTFFHIFKNVTNTMKNVYISDKRKSEIIAVITEFEKDLDLCDDTFRMNTMHNFNLTTHPYIRYLGYPVYGNMHVSINDQKFIKDPILNVRLQEQRYPKISLKLDRFDGLNDELAEKHKFVFNKLCLVDIDNCITYTCMLCNENLGTYANSKSVKNHLENYHGVEPDWICSKCLLSFTNEYLVRNRWGHNCE